MPTRTLTVMPAPKGKTAVQASRVVLYARVSSKDQEKEGYSIPAQQRSALLWQPATLSMVERACK